MFSGQKNEKHKQINALAELGTTLFSVLIAIRVDRLWRLGGARDQKLCISF